MLDHILEGAHQIVGCAASKGILSRSGSHTIIKIKPSINQQTNSGRILRMGKTACFHPRYEWWNDAVLV
jgi:hypothetical protein